MDFVSFNKIARLNRECVVTEKIDGTNAQIIIDGTNIYAGSRNKFITTDNDNFGFAKWVEDNKECLMQLGDGRYFGEWWGHKIQRGYNLKERKFSLFNVSKFGESRPSCCDVVPIIWSGLFEDMDINSIMQQLLEHGSYASPGFMNPEGIIIYHTASKTYFKKTFEKDDIGKNQYLKGI